MKSVLQILPIQPHVTVDLTVQGAKCPVPLVEAVHVLKNLRPGEVLLLISNCPGTKDDLFSWVEQTSNEVVQVDTHASGKSDFYIRKGRQPGRTANVILDVRGVACPGPVVEGQKILAGLQPGEVLKLVSSCTAALAEVETWVRNTPHQLLETREIENGAREFYIRRG